MKIELIATLCVLSVGVILGVGFSTDGAWLDTADKIASVVSCLVTCAAFVYAWKAYHSWKLPLLLSAIEQLIERLESAERKLGASLIKYTLSDSLPQLLEGIDAQISFNDVSVEFLEEHTLTVLPVLHSISSEIPSSTIGYLKQMAPEQYKNLSNFLEAVRPVRVLFLEIRGYVMDKNKTNPAKNLEYSKRSASDLQSLLERIKQLEKNLKEAHIRSL